MKKKFAQQIKKIGFLGALIKYRHFVLYSTKTSLKSDISKTRLSWLWWILEPFLRAMVYTIFMGIVMGRGRAGYHGYDFGVYIFFGVSIWQLFMKTVNGSPKTIKKNKQLISATSIPKFILVVNDITENFVHYLFALIVLIPMYLFSSFDITFNALLLPIPIFILVLTSFWISLLLMHFGAFVEDLSKIVSTLMVLVMYASGVIFPVATTIGAHHPTLAYAMIHFNPAAFAIQEIRTLTLGDNGNYGLDWPWVFGWIAVGILFTFLLLKLIRKYENMYIKMV